MPRSRVKQFNWEALVEYISVNNSRYMVRRYPTKRPGIYIRDKQLKKEFVLKGLFHAKTEDLETTRDLIDYIGTNDWLNNISIDELIEKMDNNEPLDKEGSTFNWEGIKDITFEHIERTMKASSSRNIQATVNRLLKDQPDFEWDAILKWLRKYHSVEQRPYKNNLDGLEQIRSAITNKYGEEPKWLKRENLIEQRNLHNDAKRKEKRYATSSDLGDIRGIPTKKEAEKYLNKIEKNFPLEHWCLSMMLLYGLRNHELHHIGEITTENDVPKSVGWVYVPGNWRTKSKFEHWTFPVYPEWIEKYKLSENFRKFQDQLRKRAAMKIVSALDKTKRWDKNNPKDKGVCDNNDYLGSWITIRMRSVLPKWEASIPDAKGLIGNDATKQQIRPYDLRHTWAIRVATDKRWEKVDDSLAAKAMGHDLTTHLKHYQRWISSETIMLKMMSDIKVF